MQSNSTYTLLSPPELTSIAPSSMNKSCRLTISLSLFMPLVRYGFFTATTHKPIATIISPTAYWTPPPPTSNLSLPVSAILLYTSATSNHQYLGWYDSNMKLRYFISALSSSSCTALSTSILFWPGSNFPLTPCSRYNTNIGMPTGKMKIIV